MKFFRPLRKNTNTNINYIKYAVGEVVLVVIGILIALQVNSFKSQFSKKTWHIFT